MSESQSNSYEPVMNSCIFSINHEFGVKKETLEVQIWYYIKDNLPKEIFGDRSEAEKPSYTVIIPTSLGFREALAVFRQIGITERAEIPLLSYGDNVVRNIGNDFLGRLDKKADGVGPEIKSKSEYHRGKPEGTVRYHQTPFVVGDLDEAFIRDVANTPPPVFVKIRAEPGAVPENDFEVIYQQIKPDHWIIAYLDDKIILPRFREILKTASFELSEREIGLLEEVIEKALRLK